MSEIVVYDYILVKLASRCNLACKYCYWFRDDDVYKKPKLLTLEVENQFLIKLKKYLKKYHLPEFEIILHGGEPMLFGKKRFDSLCKKFRILEKELKIKLIISITTNAVLIDDEWAKLFKMHRIHVGVSVDGNQRINDSQRIDFKGKGTYVKIKKALEILRTHDIEPGVLSVCMVNEDPEEFCRGIIEDLGIKHFDVLIPDATYLDKPKPIFSFYQKLFDLWYDKYYQNDIFITFIECVSRSILGQRSLSNALGYTPVKTITLLADGSLEPLDYLRITGNGFTASNFNVFDHELDELQNHPLWKEVYHSSLNLAQKCNQCKFKYACGGGPIQSRWNLENRYDNPSVYCDDLYRLFEHAQQRIHADIYLHEEKGNSSP